LGHSISEGDTVAILTVLSPDLRMYQIPGWTSFLGCLQNCSATGTSPNLPPPPQQKLLPCLCDVLAQAGMTRIFPLQSWI
jgi:hypothetical protein